MKSDILLSHALAELQQTSQRIIRPVCCQHTEAKGLVGFMLRFRPVRILLDYRPALRERTGVGEFVHELAKALAADVHQSDGDSVSILTSSWKDRPASGLAAELPGVSIADRRIPVRLLTWAWNRLQWPPVEWLAGAADVVHAQAPLLIPAIRAAQVVTIHDLHFLSHPDQSEAEMRRDFPERVQEHARHADHIVTSSVYAAGEVTRRLGVSSDRVTVCPPGAPSWAADVRRQRANEKQDHILFMGTLDPRKNIGGLLDAYARLRARRSDAPTLVLAGRLREAVRQALRPVEIEPLRQHVRVLGYVAEAERRRLYVGAQMLALPSFEEGFGLPVLEAMACGVPVVISNRGSLPEVAGSAASPVNPEDPEALAREMERLLDPDAAAIAASNGLAEASRYSWAACARAAREAYRSAVTTRRERGR
jgi:glycosyltransferase involved in cell wall biosynthesis